MTDLDRIEIMARAIEERRTHSMTFEVTTDLARFILRALPLIRAAEACRDATGCEDYGYCEQCGDHCGNCTVYGEHRRDCPQRTAPEKLAAAVDAFRSRGK